LSHSGSPKAKNKQSKQAPEKIETIFRQIALNSPDTIYLFDITSNKAEFINHNEFLGYSHAELKASNSILNKIHPDDIVLVQTYWQQVLQGSPDGQKPTEYRLQSKAGNWEWVQSRASAIKNVKQVKPKQVLILLTVITERKIAEIKLKESEEKYRELIKYAPIGIYEVDFDGLKLRSVNQGLCKLLGYTEKELLARNPFDLVFDESKKILLEKIKAGLPGKNDDSAQIRAKTKDGRSVFGILNAKMSYTNGKPDGVLIFTNDITELKKVEDELRQSEELYRTLFDNSQDGFILTEPIYDENGRAIDFRFLKVNRAYKHQTGARLAVVEGKRAREAAVDLESEWISLVGRVAKTGKSVYYENFNQHTGRWYDAHYFPFGKGQVGILFRDITERKTAEEALRESEEKTRSVLVSSPDAITIADLSGCIVECNQATAKLHGYESKKELCGKNVFDLMSKRDQPCFRKLMAKNKPVKNLEFTALRKDGSEFPCEMSGNVILNAQGTPIFMMAITKDTSEHKKSEQALKDSQKKYRDLTETTNDFVWEMDAQGRYTYCSPQMEKLWGLKPLDMIGKTPFDVMPPVDRERALELFLKMGNSSEPFKGLQTTAFDSQGHLIYVETNGVSFFDDGGKLLGFRGISRDITERKKLEKQLQDRERLAAIGATAGMVGHDIRNPLQAMIGDIFLLKSELSMMPQSDKKDVVKESLDGIEKNILYINKIVADLQDFAKPLNPHVEETDLKLIIDEVLSKNGLPENVTVNVKVEAVARKIPVDPTYIDRVIANLVSNAVQAMPEGGKMAIHAAKEANDVIISVKDTGVGIPEALKNKLFTPMFTTKSKGQGFGLAVVKRMTEALGGTVSFESQEGKGTKFIVRLPAQKS
jgi:PAS domain S-box-containing protein